MSHEDGGYHQEIDINFNSNKVDLKIPLKNNLVNYKCKYCLHLTRYKMHIIEHMLESHSIYLMECPDKDCKKQFKDEWRLKRHIELNRDHPTLKHQYKNFNEIMKIHVDINLHKPDFKCPVCDNYYLETYELLKEHINSFHSGFELESYFICKECGRLFRNARKLKLHIYNVHSGKRKSQTTKTGNQITNDDNNQDMLTFQDFDEPREDKKDDEDDESERTCHVCKRVFKDIKKFHKHNKSQHGIDENGKHMLECPVCERNFYNYKQLERHMHIHEIWVNDFNADNNVDRLNTNSRSQQPNIDSEIGNTNNFNYTIDCWLSNASLNSSKENISFDENNNLNLTNYGQTEDQNNILNEAKKIYPDYRTVQSLLYCYECDFCRIFFKSKKLLFNHKRTIHKLKPVFKCLHGSRCKLTIDVVDGQFDDLNEFLEHAKIHSQKNIFCTRCNEQFSGKVQLRNHMKNIHYTKLNDTDCIFCKIHFKTKEELREHYKVTNHRKIKSKTKLKSRRKTQPKKLNPIFKSNAITISNTQNEQILLQNQLTAVSNFPINMIHKCLTCLQEFPSANSLHNHLATHDDLNLFSCEICQKAFKTRKDLSTHATEHDYNKNKTCGICFMTFKTSFHMKRHELTRHTNERPFQCEKCQMTFARKDKLKQHQAKHIEHPLYKCLQCSKGFYRKEHLKDHEISRHSKNYPFICEHCKKGFVHSKDLYRHIRVRHLSVNSDEVKIIERTKDKKKTKKYNENSVEDDVQNSNADNLYDVTMNEKLTDTNANEKLFSSSSISSSYFSSLTSLEALAQEVSKSRSKKLKCDLCNNLFINERNLKKHISSKHSLNNSYSCSVCKMEFSSIATVKAHVEQNHTELKCGISKKSFSNLFYKKRQIMDDNEVMNFDFFVKRPDVQAEFIDLTRDLIKDKNTIALNSKTQDNSLKKFNNDELNILPSSLNSNSINNILNNNNFNPQHNQQQQQFNQYYPNLLLPSIQMGNNNLTYSSDLSLNANIVRQLVQQSTALQQQNHNHLHLMNNNENSFQQHQQSQNLNYKMLHYNNSQHNLYQQQFSHNNNVWNPISQPQHQQMHNFDFSNLQYFHQKHQQHMMIQANQQGIHITNNINIKQSPQQMFDVNLDNLNFPNFNFQSLNYQDNQQQLPKNH